MRRRGIKRDEGAVRVDVIGDWKVDLRVTTAHLQPDTGSVQ